MATPQMFQPRIVGRSIDPDASGVSVHNVGKRYWLRRPLPPTLQQTVVAMVRRVGTQPFWALQDVSFEVGPGESIGIIGGNGAGKSTLLRLICGLGRPTTGQVRVRGRLAALIELGAGFHPHLTGRENLMVSGVIGGLRRREVRALEEEIIEFAELGDFIDQPLRTFSQGMQLRLGFSVAIHADPSVMLIDEALSVGDAHFQQKCLSRVERFRRDGKTLVLVSHEMETIRTFCTRALWLRRGRVAADGPVHSVVARYEQVMRDETLVGDRDDEPAHRG